MRHAYERDSYSHPSLLLPPRTAAAGSKSSARHASNLNLRRATFSRARREIMPPRVKHNPQVAPAIQVARKLFARRACLLGLGKLDDTLALGPGAFEEDLGEDDDADGFE